MLFRSGYFIHLRAGVLEGDYRLLYLAWLKTMTIYGDRYEIGDYEEDDQGFASNDLEPPLPPGLKKLSPLLQNFIQVFEIDPFLVRAAAEASPDPMNDLEMDYCDLINRLTRAECDDFLRRLAEGDPGVGLSLRKRLGAFLPQEHAQSANRRSIQQLLQRAKQLEKDEKKLQTRAAHRKHIAEMKALAAREAQVWHEVETLLANGRKIASVYDEATEKLEKLKQLSEFQDTRDIFTMNLLQLS